MFRIGCICVLCVCTIGVYMRFMCVRCVYDVCDVWVSGCKVVQDGCMGIWVYIMYMYDACMYVFNVCL